MFILQISGQYLLRKTLEKSTNNSLAWGILSFVTFKKSSVDCPRTTIDSHIRVPSPWISFKSSWNKEAWAAFSSADIIITLLEVGSEKKMDIYIKKDDTKNLYAHLLYIEGYGFMVFNATFNNISVTSRRSALLVWETGVPAENHHSVASHWETLSHNVVSSTPRHERGSNSQLKWW